MKSILCFLPASSLPFFGRRGSGKLSCAYAEHKEREMHIAGGLFGFHLAFPQINGMKSSM